MSLRNDFHRLRSSLYRNHLLREIMIELDESTARLFSCWCIRNTPLAEQITIDTESEPKYKYMLSSTGTTWDLVDKDRRAAVEIAERYASGQGNEEEMFEAARLAGYPMYNDNIDYVDPSDEIKFAIRYLVSTDPIDLQFVPGNVADTVAWEVCRGVYVHEVHALATEFQKAKLLERLSK